jgi:hypothetical protein
MYKSISPEYLYCGFINTMYTIVYAMMILPVCRWGMMKDICLYRLLNQVGLRNQVEYDILSISSLCMTPSDCTFLIAVFVCSFCVFKNSFMHDENHLHLICIGSS